MTIAAPKTVLTPGIETGMRNGRQAMAHINNSPCSPIASISSRRVMVLPLKLPMSLCKTVLRLSDVSVKVKFCVMLYPEAISMRDR